MLMASGGNPGLGEDLAEPSLTVTGASFDGLTGVVPRGTGHRPAGEQPVNRYEQDDSQVTALLDFGGRVVEDVLISADGIRSSVREQLLGDGEPWVFQERHRPLGDPDESHAG